MGRGRSELWGGGGVSCGGGGVSCGGGRSELWGRGRSELEHPYHTAPCLP